MTPTDKRREALEAFNRVMEKTKGCALMWNGEREKEIGAAFYDEIVAPNMARDSYVETICEALASPAEEGLDIKLCLEELARAKNFIGGIVAIRGYGDDAYSSICRVMGMLDKVLRPAPVEKGD